MFVLFLKQGFTSSGWPGTHYRTMLASNSQEILLPLLHSSAPISVHTTPDYCDLLSRFIITHTHTHTLHPVRHVLLPHLEMKMRRQVCKVTNNLVIHIKFFIHLVPLGLGMRYASSQRGSGNLCPHIHHFLLPWTSWNVLQKQCGWKWSQPSSCRLC